MKQPTPTPGQMRTAIIALALSQQSRDTLERLDLENEREVATIGRLLKAGAVTTDTTTRLIAALQDKGAKPSRDGLEKLAKAVRDHAKPVEPTLESVFAIRPANSRLH